VVFKNAAKNDKFIWNLTNDAGRNVANGTYLIIAKVKGIGTNNYIYSANIGVKR
jgi:hypothetical protein